MKSAIYLRVSTLEQNPENQLKECLDLCKRLEIKAPQVFEEHASAWKQDVERPILNRLLDRAKKGELKTLVVWDFDRIYRNRKKTVEFIRNYGRLGLKVYSARQPWMEDIEKIPSPFDEIIKDLMVQVVGWMAEEESRKKSERVRAAYKNRKTKWGRKKHRVSRKKIQDLAAANPTLSSRQLADLINKETGLRISHQTIVNTLKEKKQ